MNFIHLLILVLFLISGCGLGRVSVKDGVAKFSMPFDWPRSQEKDLASQLELVHVGMSKSDLLKAFTGFKQRGSQKEGNEEWITFSNWATEGPTDTVTFYLLDGKVRDWQNN